MVLPADSGADVLCAGGVVPGDGVGGAAAAGDAQVGSEGRGYRLGLRAGAGADDALCGVSVYGGAELSD